MNQIFIIAAAVLSALTFLIHTFAGGKEVARPLLADTALPPESKWLNYYCWHITTVMLAFMAAGFAWLACTPDTPSIIWLTTLCLALSLLSAWVARKGGINPLKLPSTSLFFAIGALGALALYFANPQSQSQTNAYDPALAQALGADEYGMHSYVYAELVTGPNDESISDEARRAELFAGHFSNMARLAEDGHLVLAGPFMDARPVRGLYIFDVDTIDQAKDLVQTDPAVAAGIFDVNYRKYYGSAALKRLSHMHKRIQKSEIK